MSRATRAETWRARQATLEAVATAQREDPPPSLHDLARRLGLSYWRLYDCLRVLETRGRVHRRFPWEIAI